MSGRWRRHEPGRSKRDADKRRLAAVERDLQAFPLSGAAAQARQEREAVGELRRMVELIKEFRVVTFTLDPDGVYYEAGEEGKHSYGVLMRGEDG